MLESSVITTSGLTRTFGYLTGRVDLTAVIRAFGGVTLGLAFFGATAGLLWRRGLRSYKGTGA
jgi:ABC-type uncharacterized transport system permease subunit